MSKQYTPGPWHIGRNGDKCAKNHAICAGPIVLAKVYGRGYPASEGWSPDSEADARLMSIAPELAEACQALLDYRDHNTLNFQLEKLDGYLHNIRAILERVEQ